MRVLISKLWILARGGAWSSRRIYLALSQLLISYRKFPLNPPVCLLVCRSRLHYFACRAYWWISIKSLRSEKLLYIDYFLNVRLCSICDGPFVFCYFKYVYQGTYRLTFTDFFLWICGTQFYGTVRFMCFFLSQFWAEPVVHTKMKKVLV